MYTQYFPRGQWTDCHRHDSEDIAVWVNVNGNPIKAAFSAHGDYLRKINSRSGSNNWDGKRVRVQYARSGDFTHYVVPSTTDGATPLFMEWKHLTVEARRALDSD